MTARLLRIQFAASEDDLRVIDEIAAHYGGIDRQSVIRIAIKLLLDRIRATVTVVE